MSLYLPRYEIEVRHAGLGKYRHIHGTDEYVVEEKARAQEMAWNAQWARAQEKEARLKARVDATAAKELAIAEAELLTQDAMNAVSACSDILSATLAVNDAIDWEALKVRVPFAETPPQPPSRMVRPPEPNAADPKYRPKFTVLDHLLVFTKARKIEAARAQLAAGNAAHHELIASMTARYNSAKAAYPVRQAQWEERKAAHDAALARQHTEIDTLRDRYLTGDAQAVDDYIDQVLASSTYPDCITRDWDFEFSPEQKLLVLDYDLPRIEDIPTLRSVRYVATKGEFSEKHASKAETTELYDDVVYKCALRTIHELFESDLGGHIDNVAFNGWVAFVDKATGKDARACIMSVVVFRNDFLTIDLARADPRECFRSLRGVASTKLHSYAPIPPRVQINRADKRFIASENVMSELEAGRNLASMDWQEFEHLVREVFEGELAANGGEVRITQASRDGGVDAIAFDPDPIRGGKIVIQAKRYTNAVELSAVRDLYGTVQNERAMKGILVTTSTFGPDAYRFAQDKPLTLIDGSGLLYLLQKRGVSARIDIAEAKRIRI